MGDRRVVQGMPNAARLLRSRSKRATLRAMTTVHDFQVKTIDGQNKSLGEYAGNPLLIVNVASRCGLTPQYTALEQLQRQLPAQEPRPTGDQHTHRLCLPYRSRMI